MNTSTDELHLKILDLAERELGEIGNFLIEDGFVSFEVYGSYYEDAPKLIQSDDKKVKLKLFDKFDDPFFTLCYKIYIK